MVMVSKCRKALFSPGTAPNWIFQSVSAKFVEHGRTKHLHESCGAYHAAGCFHPSANRAGSQAARQTGPRSAARARRSAAVSLACRAGCCARPRQPRLPRRGKATRRGVEPGGATGGAKGTNEPRVKVGRTNPPPPGGDGAPPPSTRGKGGSLG